MTSFPLLNKMVSTLEMMKLRSSNKIYPFLDTEVKSFPPLTLINSQNLYYKKIRTHFIHNIFFQSDINSTI
jgi:hypothetical protein